MRDGTAKGLSALHAAVYRASRGRIGSRLVNNDMLLLRTTGRRSGQPHTVPLLFLRRGAAFLVIASWGGRDRHPEWYLNLVADPRCSVTIKGEERSMSAHTTDREERATLWALAVAAHDGYAGYQAKTERQIPVVLLTDRRV